ncbi:hypothetical protein QR680_018739 [Steinernema hermaphroditum]|uniref:Sorting nexin-17 n=1 Tax=Steinernema hermaphroditum TaxID=289476 RepID=A0AA39LQT5_9BILA|nr:hypothetical protein QR680_018739 [Steinernema hermaphroditum]
MLITFKTINQKTFQMELDGETRIGAVKEQMVKEHGEDQFCLETLKLIYNGKVLEDDETVAQMEFDEKKFVVVMNPKKKPAPPAPAAEPTPQPAEPSTSATTTPTQEATTTVTAAAVTEATSTTPANESPAPASVEQAQLPTQGDVPEEHKTTVEAIMAMGYDRPQVVLALKAAFYNADRAVEYLISGIPANANAAENVTIGPPEEVGESNLDFLSSPQFEELRQIVLENPAALPQIMQEIQQLNPDLLQFIRDNQALFLERLNAPVSAAESEAVAPVAAADQQQADPVQPAAGAVPQRGQPYHIQLTPDEHAALERIRSMGFPETIVLEAFLACDKNEELTINYILTHMEDLYYAIDIIMLHVAIPDYQTLSEPDGKKYTVYNIHCNGIYHASVRYSELFTLHERLVENFGFRLNAPDFPPKKIWRSLDDKAINDRRIGLKKYFQGLIQNEDVVRHYLFENAFLEYQVDSYQPSSYNVKVEVFLPDGSHKTVQCLPNNNSEVILKLALDACGTDTRNIASFALFLARDRNAQGDGELASTSDKFDMLLVRMLRNFESPYITQQNVNRKSAPNGVFHKIVIRKIVWDPRMEESLLDDPGAVRLLYLQAKSDIQNGHLMIAPNVKERLNLLDEQESYVQYLRLCHLQPNYSYEVLLPVTSDYPKPGTGTKLKVGRRTIVLEYENELSQAGFIQAVFRAVRIRIWRITHTPADHTTAPSIFEFHYLVSHQQQRFDWIRLNTDQCILLSQLFQSISAEILAEHKGNQPPEDMYKFDDDITNKASDLLEASKASSIINSEDGTVKDLNLLSDGYESFDDVFITISDALPRLREGRPPYNITNDDL